LTIGALALAAAVAEPASAAPLSKDECEAMKSEQSALVAKGVRADMERGPDWAKVNLTSERMKLVERLIGVDEQVLFRCATRPSGIAEEQAGAAETGEAKPPAAAVAADKPADAAAAEAPKPKRQARGKKGEPAERAASAKPKPKPSDAYTPPPGEPQSVLTAPAGVAPAAPKAE
jgi:hypothetical protein